MKKQDYVVAYDGIFAKVVLADERFDIGVTIDEARKLAREHMQLHRNKLAIQIANLDERLEGL
jgi:hypothetical protein